MNIVEALKKRRTAMTPTLKWVALVTGVLVGEALVALSVTEVEFWKLALASVIPLFLLWYARGRA
jgi:hypothetical protein